MKLTRRGWFGAAIGGVMVAPGVIKQTDEEIKQWSYPQSKYNDTPYASETQELSIKGIQNIENTKKHWQKIINGEFDGWQLDQLNEIDKDTKRIIFTHNLNSLKSTSSQFKKLIYQNRLKEDRKNTWIEEAKRSLKNMLGV